VVLMATLLACGVCVASGLVASTILAPADSPAAIEPIFWGQDSQPDTNLDVLAYSGSIFSDISTVRAFVP
jgi:hypothetical protein